MLYFLAKNGRMSPGRNCFFVGSFDFGTEIGDLVRDIHRVSGAIIKKVKGWAGPTPETETLIHRPGGAIEDILRSA